MSRIVVDNVEAGYGSVRVLHGVSVSVDPGETVVLLGTNGNGKSTLINCIMGIVAPSAGSITYETDEGEKIELVGKTPEDVVELGITLVPGRPAAVPAAHGGGEPDAGRLPGIGAETDRRQPGVRVRGLPGLGRAPAPARGLHVRRRAADAGHRARADVGTRILLIDEPSVGLAPILVSRVIAKIRELKEQRSLTVLMAEQNFNQAIKIADRGYIIVHGEIAFAAATAADLSENEMVKQYYLGA